MTTAEAADEATRVTLEAWLVTDVGVVRDHNEDAAFMEPSRGFFIVADGMGGHAAGEIASAMAVDTVRKLLEAAKDEIDTFKKAPTDAGRRGLVQLLQNAVLQAHQAVYQRGQTETDKQGMGTTLDVVLIAGAEAFVAHVGDSRTYLVREGRSSQITTDHTVAEVLVIEGKLTIEEAQVSPLRTILVNAIGVSQDVGVEMAHVTLRKDDRLLLCSDGLHDYFPAEDEIAQRMSNEKPGDALHELAELAKTRGGHDNITGIAVHVTDLIDNAVPNRLADDSTQPVDIQNNPFAADEPTQTALGATSARSDTGAASTQETQPMRTVDVGTLPTVPPPIKRTGEKPIDPVKKQAEPVNKERAEAAKAQAKPEEPDDDEKGDPKHEASDGKDDTKDAASEVTRPGYAPTDAGETGDAVPSESVATADTGRISLPKKD
jgi:serine/threonine protein phosphatase PrpC